MAASVDGTGWLYSPFSDGLNVKVRTDKSVRSKGFEVQICSAIAGTSPKKWRRAYCTDGADSAVGDGCGGNGTGVTAFWLAVARVGAAAARGTGFRCGAPAFGAAGGDAIGTRAVGVSGSGVMMLTAGIELAVGKSMCEGAMPGLAPGPIEPVVAGPLDSVSAWPSRASRSIQLAEYRAT